MEILDDPPSSSPALRAVRILDILITLQGLRSGNAMGSDDKPPESAVHSSAPVHVSSS